MANVRPLAFKLLFVGLPLFLILWLVSDMGLLTAITTTLAISLMTYLVGGLGALPRASVIPATLLNGTLVWAILWILFFFGTPVANILYPVLTVILADGLVYHPFLKRLFTMDSMGPRV